MAADIEDKTACQPQGVQGLAQGPSTLAIAPSACNDEAKGAWTLQLLPCGRQQPGFVGILQGSGETAVSVAEPTEPKAESDMGEIETGSAVVCVSRALSVGRSDRELGACVKGLFSVRVSMTEEPGARKSYAGICAGLRRVTGCSYCDAE